MPLRTAYPNSGDLLIYLEAAGLSVPSALTTTLATAAAAGWRDFERLADRRMLADTSDVIRRFDPPLNGPLFIPDLISVTTLQYQPTGATAETLTANTDFWLEPYNALADTDRPQPYTRIQFRRTWYGASESLRRSIIITGKWGYAASIPDDVWLAMLARGASQLHALLAHGVTGGVVAWKDADASETYGEKPLEALRLGWEATFQLAAANYRRLF